MPSSISTEPGGVIHDQAALMHQRSAARHDASAAHWAARGDPDWAGYERRLATLERASAALEVDRSTLRRLRDELPKEPGDAARAEVERLSAQITRRAVRLRADDDVLDRERVRLQAARRRDGQRREPRDPGPSPAGRDGAVAPAPPDLRSTAGRLAATLLQAADALEKSAQLADAHAVRQTGRNERIAADERGAAARAREAAARARHNAERWLDVAARDGGGAR